MSESRGKRFEGLSNNKNDRRVAHTKKYQSSETAQLIYIGG